MIIIFNTISMKKLVIITFFTLFVSSCGFFNKDENVTPETDSETIISIENTNSWNITWTWEIKEEWKYTFDENWTEVKIETNSGGQNVSVEKNIENIVETNEETSKDNITEEEILNDIDSLINDIINSAENG